MYVPSGLGMVRTTRPVGQVVDTTTTFSRGGAGLDPLARTGGIPVDDGRTVPGFDSPVVTVSSTPAAPVASDSVAQQTMIGAPAPSGNVAGISCGFGQKQDYSSDQTACVFDPFVALNDVLMFPGRLVSSDSFVQWGVSAAVWVGAVWMFSGSKKRGRR